MIYVLNPPSLYDTYVLNPYRSSRSASVRRSTRDSPRTPPSTTSR
jgi:hypothetical protein